MVNFNKSALCISKGAGKKHYNALSSILGVRKMTDDKKYLGNKRRKKEAPLLILL